MAHLVGMGVDMCQPVGIDTLLDTDLYLQKKYRLKSVQSIVGIMALVIERVNVS